MDAADIIPVLLRFALCGIAEGEDGKDVMLGGELEHFLDGFHSFLDRGNAEPDTAKTQGVRFQPDILVCYTKVDLRICRADSILAVGGNDKHWGIFGAASVGADRGQFLNQVFIGHNIKFPRLLVSRRGCCHGGAKKGLDFLRFNGLILKFADTDAVEDTIHGEDSFPGWEMCGLMVFGQGAGRK